jgi:carbon-monoxide dehydrogenase large subunit
MERKMIETKLPRGLERRIEDVRLITGKGHYVDDVRLPEGRPAVLHMAVTRSPYGHANIDNINLEAARALPGVVAAFSGAELVNDLPAIEPIPMPVRDLKKPVRKPLAVGKARFVGDPVAVALAEDPYTAQDARDMVEVEYTPLPAVTDPEAALQEGAPLLYEEFGTNMAFRSRTGGGDIRAAFEQADQTVRLRVVNQRVAPASLEGRACLFDYDPQSGQFSAWVSSQAIYTARETLARYTGVPRERIHVYNAEVGGGFGSKTNFGGEELIAAVLAVKLGRPVKWVESRSENLAAQTHGRGQINYIEAAFKKDGTLLAIRVHTIADLGAYLAGSTMLVPNGTPSMLNGPYKLQAVQSQVVGAFTNKTPTAAYRGAGRPEATYILERTMDRIAHVLHMDPAEVRRRNLIEPGAFPYKTPAGPEYDSGNYAAALDKALELADYAGWRAKQEEQRKANSSRLMGIGVTTFVEVSGGAISRPGMPRDSATVRIHRDGTLEVMSGVATNGQGHYTAFAQIAAQVFGVPGNQVKVRMNDTTLPAFGIGTFGSRTTQISGSVVYLAAEAVKQKALQVAARHLEAAVDDLELAEGKICVRGVPSRSVSLGELARMVEEQPDLIEREAPNPVNGAPIEGLAAWRDFLPSNATYSSGTHVAVVEVDSETGDVHILRYVVVDDCGRVLNHYLADAQVHGALTQGIGQALYEEALYGEDGQLLASTLMDYTMPNTLQVPTYITDMVETASPINPLGAKGIGEGGTIGAPPTIVNAVLDALSPLGISTIDMPLRPQKVWGLIQAAHNGTLQQPDPVPPPVFTEDSEEEGQAPTITI